MDWRVQKGKQKRTSMGFEPPAGTVGLMIE